MKTKYFNSDHCDPKTLMLAARPLCIAALYLHYNSVHERQLKELWNIAMDKGWKEQAKEIAETLLLPNLNSGHASSYNDRYYVSQKVGIHCENEVLQGVLKNMMTGYMEKTTHDEYPFQKLLEEQEVTTKEEDWKIAANDLYFYLPVSAIKVFAKLHNLREDELEIITVEACLSCLGLRNETTQFGLNGGHPTYYRYPELLEAFVREDLREVLQKRLKPYLPKKNEDKREE